MDQKELIQAFNLEMMGIYTRALKEVNYKASRFFQMLNEVGGVETARTLINSAKVSEGYIALWDRKRLDLTVEATVFSQSRWHPLFTKDEIQLCEKRLKDYKYKF